MKTKAMVTKAGTRKSREGGFIVSLELVFIATILVIGLLVGWVAIRDALVFELHDVAEAAGSLNQSYAYRGVYDLDPLENTETMGGMYRDEVDTSDEIGVTVSILPPAPSEDGLVFN